MKKCIRQEILLQYIEDELNRTDKSKVHRHLQTCDECHQKQEELLQIESNLKAYKREEPSALRKQTYYAALDQQFSGKKTSLYTKHRTRSYFLNLRFTLGAAAVLVLIVFLLRGKAGKIHAPQFKLNSNSQMMIVRNSSREVDAFLNESEMLFLEIKNEGKPITFQNNRKRARQLIGMLGEMHDIGILNNNVQLLSYLVQAELIFYEVANFEDQSSEMKMRFIKEAVQSEKLWKTLKMLQNSKANSETYIHVSV